MDEATNADRIISEFLAPDVPGRHSSRLLDADLIEGFVAKARQVILDLIETERPQDSVAEHAFQRTVTLGGPSEGSVARNRRGAAQDLAMLVVEASLIEAMRQVFVANDKARVVRPNFFVDLERRSAERGARHKEQRRSKKARPITEMPVMTETASAEA